MSAIDHRACIGGKPEDREWRGRGGLAHPPSIGPGGRIEAFVSVDAGTERPTRVGAGTWLMKHVHVGHDALIGSDCDLAPGTVIGGFAVVGNGCKLGIGALVLPYRKIGDGATVGAGAVVTNDVPAGVTVVGNPARVLTDSERSPLPHSERVAREFVGASIEAPCGGLLGYRGEVGAP